MGMDANETRSRRMCRMPIEQLRIACEAHACSRRRERQPYNLLFVGEDKGELIIDVARLHQNGIEQIQLVAIIFGLWISQSLKRPASSGGVRRKARHQIHGRGPGTEGSRL